MAAMRRWPGLTSTPEKFACGVDIVGPSNLFTLLETIPPYWESIKRQFYQRMGNPTTDQGRAVLKAASPLTYVDQIKRPLLIGQGANDPRVNKRESDQIVAAMKAKNIPVTYVLFPDEGHGFARPVNNIAFNAVAENFLQPCLGGRAEPIGDGLKASSIQVLNGAEYVNGLKQALARNRRLRGVQLRMGRRLAYSRRSFPCRWSDAYTVARRRQIYEGKAKILYEGPEPGTLIQYFKDDATAFNAQKRGTISGKGVHQQPHLRAHLHCARRRSASRPTSSAASTCASS